MSGIKAVVLRSARCGFLAAALLSAGSLNAASVVGFFHSTEEFDIYVSTSADELGSLQSQTENGDVQTVEADLVEGATQYLHIAVRGPAGSESAFIGNLHLNDFGFIFPNGGYVITTDSSHWSARSGGLSGPDEPVSDLGPNGIDPWGTVEELPVDARFVWAGTGSGDRVFSIRIEPDTPGSVYWVQLSSTDGHLFARTRDPVSRSLVGEDVEAEVDVDQGLAGVRTRVVVADEVANSHASGAGGFAAHDFVVHSTGAESTVDLSLNLRLKGLMAGGAGAGGLTAEESYGSVVLYVAVFIDTHRIFDSSVQIRADHLVGTGNDRSEITTYPREGFEDLLPDDLSGEVGDYVLEFSVLIDEIIRTGTVTVDVGVPFSVWAFLNLSSLADIENGRAIAIADFTDGLGFPVLGDVFNLPEGFTIESESMAVAGNRFPAAEPPLPFTEGIFLKVGDIAGEAMAGGYENWIDVSDFGSRVDRPEGLSRRVTPTHGDLVVMKQTDASSPKLIEGLTRGTVFPEVRLVANLPGLGGSRAAFDYRLKQSQVTEFLVADEGNRFRPTETVSLDYERADWIYRLIDEDGSTSGEVVAWWDVESGTGGSRSRTGDNSPPVIETVGNQPVGSGEEGSVGLTVGDEETTGEDLQVELSTDRPDLLTDLKLDRSGGNLKITYTTSALRSGFATINATVSDGTDTRSISIPILIDVEMTPYEGFLSAYFSEDELFDPFLTAPLLDPDGDGLATQLEFLLGTNPREFTAASEAMEIRPDPASDGQAIKVTFRRRIDDPNVKGYFWGSEDARNWTRYDTANPLYEETTSTGENPLYEEVTATIVRPDGASPTFVRFQSVGVF